MSECIDCHLVLCQEAKTVSFFAMDEFLVVVLVHASSYTACKPAGIEKGVHIY